MPLELIDLSHKVPSVALKGRFEYVMTSPKEGVVLKAKIHRNIGDANPIEISGPRGSFEVEFQLPGPAIYHETEDDSEIKIELILTGYNW